MSALRDNRRNTRDVLFGVPQPFLRLGTLGNIVGGLALVTLLNYGQVAGSREGSPAEPMGEDQ